jgi:hypothetical protein
VVARISCLRTPLRLCVICRVRDLEVRQVVSSVRGVVFGPRYLGVPLEFFGVFSGVSSGSGSGVAALDSGDVLDGGVDEVGLDSSAGAAGVHRPCILHGLAGAAAACRGCCSFPVLLGPRVCSVLSSFPFDLTSLGDRPAGGPAP